MLLCRRQSESCRIVSDSIHSTLSRSLREGMVAPSRQSFSRRDGFFLVQRRTQTHALSGSRSVCLSLVSSAQRKAWRARDSPDMTLPIGIPSTSASSW